MAQNTSDNSHCLDVFVYGTLKPGGTYWKEFCVGRTVRTTEAKVKGQLYDLGVGYPGIRLVGDDWVYGHLLTLDSAETLRRLDHLEGYSADRPSGRNEYTRRRCPIYDHSNMLIGGRWIYEMTEATMQRHSLIQIADGIWPV